MPARIAFHIDPETIMRLVERSHGTTPVKIVSASPLELGLRQKIVTESLAHFLTLASGGPATVTIVNIERFNLKLPGEG